MRGVRQILQTTRQSTPTQVNQIDHIFVSPLFLFYIFQISEYTFSLPFFHFVFATYITNYMYPSDYPIRIHFICIKISNKKRTNRQRHKSLLHYHIL